MISLESGMSANEMTNSRSDRKNKPRVMLKRRIKSSSNLKINLEDFKGNSGNEKVVKQESGGNITP